VRCRGFAAFPGLPAERFSEKSTKAMKNHPKISKKSGRSLDKIYRYIKFFIRTKK